MVCVVLYRKVNTGTRQEQGPGLFGLYQLLVSVPASTNVDILHWTITVTNGVKSRSRFQKSQSLFDSKCTDP